jgi:hypothetical protein
MQDFASTPPRFFPEFSDITSNDLDCLKETTGLAMFEWIYRNTGGPYGIIVNSYGNPLLKVVGFTDACGSSTLTTSVNSDPVTSSTPLSIGVHTVTAVAADTEGGTASCK